MCIFAVIDSSLWVLDGWLDVSRNLTSGEFVMSISCTILTFERQSFQLIDSQHIRFKN